MNTPSKFPPRKPLARAWGSAIAEQRAALKMTQVGLASEVGVEQATISKWERGHGIPSPEMQAKLVQVLGIPQDRWYRIQRDGVGAA